MNKGEILVTGGNGRLGRRFQEVWNNSQISRDYNLLHPGRNELDLANGQAVLAYMAKHQPFAVLHLGANTVLKNADDTTMAINEVGTRNVVQACQEKSPLTRIAHVGTNMVHDGETDHPYLETQPLNEKSPLLGAYAKSKLRAQIAVTGSGLSYAVFNISQPVDTQLVKDGDYLARFAQMPPEKVPSIFGDQTVSISSMGRVSKVIIEWLSGNFESRVWHLSSKDSRSPFKVISELFGKIGRDDVLKEGSLPDALRSTYPKIAALDVKDSQSHFKTDFGFISEIIDEVVEGWRSLGLVPWKQGVKYSL